MKTKPTSKITRSPSPWTVTRGTNGFTKTWQVHHVSPTRAVTIADCGAIVEQVYQGNLENHVGERKNLEHKANAYFIAEADSVAAETGLSPRELKKQRDDLLKMVTLIEDETIFSDAVAVVAEIRKLCRKAIDNVTGGAS
jgi:hypothetical protein